ncbi:MAG TPA: hypothetical protein ENK05_08715 [Gammaproteobacteria bacterium]|nr:hypothetical protein [Gammaproteobacteria bacterium]
MDRPVAGGIRITRVRTTKRFEKDYKKLPDVIKDQVDICLRLLLDDPMPGRLRFEKLNGYRNPNIYSIHVTRNHSHKLTLEIEDNVATLRRVGTHKTIDRSP